jgi:hypothetical protein
MSNIEIFNLIKRYCAKNNIINMPVDDYIIVNMCSLASIFKSESYVLVIYTKLNQYYTITTKSEYLRWPISNEFRDAHQYIPISEMIRQERSETVSILLK